ncbi:SWI-SNF complex subunit (BAF60b) [Penicillium sp. DV-2018c]|nr:SWI-SNF complex subunit (BAF60b) [Penicillium sp. DV-2018c]
MHDHIDALIFSTLFIDYALDGGEGITFVPSNGVVRDRPKRVKRDGQKNRDLASPTSRLSPPHPLFSHRSFGA